MKKAIIVTTLVVILIMAAGSGGYFYGTRTARHSDNITESPLGTLQLKVVTLEDNLKALKADVSQINPALETHVNAIVDVVNIVQPSILRLTITANQEMVSGSGFIIRSDGYVITNHHVVELSGPITATAMGGETFSATIIGEDSVRDLALLKLATSRTDFPIAMLGLGPAVVVGSDVVACGFPLGFELPGPASFTKGIISAVRTLNNLSFVQTDCELEPGSSGGCLVNAVCEVVGVTVELVIPPGTTLRPIALAIPISDVRTFVRKYLE
jgi:serine protease Do